MTPTAGSFVVDGKDPSGSSPSIQIGTWFVAGLAEKGPTNAPVLVKTLNQFKTTFGNRVAYGLLYDALDVFFREQGGSGRAYVGRVVGPAAATATVNLSDGTITTLKVTASSPGEWANSLSVITSVPVAGSFKFVVKLGEAIVEESPTLETVAQAVAWAANSTYIRMEALGTNDPVAATKALTGGADDRASVVEANWTTARKLFTRDLGPGQVSMPGRTTLEAQSGLLSHCETTNRIAILDGTDTGTVATLVSQAAALRALSTARYGGLYAPWVTVPFEGSLTRTVPPSCIVAGILARNDGLGLNPNIVAGGDNGISSYAIGVSQAAWIDSQRGELDDGGVNPVRYMESEVKVYGDCTLVNSLVDDTWIDIANARLDAFIKAESQAVGERFVFGQIGKQTPAKFGSAIEADVLESLRIAEALHGETASEAYSVDTGEAVNTDQTRAEKKLKAVVKVVMSGSAKVVEIVIVKEAN